MKLKDHAYRVLPNLLGTRRAVWVGQRVMKVVNLIKYGDPHFYHDVAIEIETCCNRACWYCPQSLEKLPKQQMTTENFLRTLARLQEIRWAGHVTYSIFNEPLLDPRIVEFVAATKRAVPGAFPIIQTNGDKLTEGMVEALLAAGMVRCIVTQHPPSNARWEQKIDAIKSRWPHIVRIQRLRNLRNVAGLIQGVVTDAPTAPCTAPQNCLVIRFNGDVGICCSDYYRKIKIGNIVEESIMQIWEKPASMRLRQQLSRGIRNPSICKSCSGGYADN